MGFKNIGEYFNSLNGNNSLFPLYSDVLAFQSKHFIPAVQFEVALFLNLIAGLQLPERILEIGFGSGVSSIFLAKGATKCCEIITLERDKNRFQRGRELLNHLSLDNIRLLHVDAFDYLAESSEAFDIIFLDAVKREYLDYLERIPMGVKQGGIFICDNILFNGKILDRELEDRYKKGVELLREFNTRLSTSEFFDTTFLNIGDGISISKRI